MTTEPESPAPQPPARRPWRRRLWLLLASLSIGLALAGVGLELFLRACLFGDAVPRSWARPFTGARRYADPGEEAFWKLRLVRRLDRLAPRPDHDPYIGWRNPYIAEDYRHERFPELGDRRLVLLYGDSFAKCQTPPAECFQGLLEVSELGDRFALVNYGVGSYGVDQMLLLLERSIDHYVDLDPIVIVAIFVDGDLHRAVTGIREWPKPRFVLEDGQLVLLPAHEADPVRYLREHPVAIRSYAWEYLLHGTDIVPEPLRSFARGDAARRGTQQAINRALIVSIQAELEARGLEYFFVIFDGPDACASPGLFGWEEPFLHETFAELGIPFVSTSPDILEDARRTGRAVDDYFIRKQRGAGHYNALGNAAASRALLSGLLGRFETPGEDLVLQGPR